MDQPLRDPLRAPYWDSWDLFEPLLVDTAIDGKLKGEKLREAWDLLGPREAARVPRGRKRFVLPVHHAGAIPAPVRVLTTVARCFSSPVEHTKTHPHPQIIERRQRGYNPDSSVCDSTWSSETRAPVWVVHCAVVLVLEVEGGGNGTRDAGRDNLLRPQRVRQMHPDVCRNLRSQTFADRIPPPAHAPFPGFAKSTPLSLPRPHPQSPSPPR
ncbi:hypothetical protein DFH08DRAFT_1084023 [Mycena albidolilacea]|uniref:Uncharacterized protein n=1 Tax=Mycena albidolilacea TaxID=1033008 RepID=A0AAD7EL17_9AGAR|nr:hypothetical protein DFH08DRAFT_1084023 [Mycena albidolilacea]